jgi:hypothetical protein
VLTLVNPTQFSLSSQLMPSQFRFGTRQFMPKPFDQGKRRNQPQQTKLTNNTIPPFQGTQTQNLKPSSKSLTSLVNGPVFGHLTRSRASVSEGELAQVLSQVSIIQEYGPFDMKQSFERLPKSLQKLVSDWAGQIDSEEIQTLDAQKRFGLVEECSDYLFEVQIQEAIEAGIVTQEKVNGLIPNFQGNLLGRRSFKNALIEVSNQYPDEQIRQFQQLIDAPDAKTAKMLLGLVTMKFVLASIAKGEPVDILAETQSRVSGELAEFAEKLPIAGFWKAVLQVQQNLFQRIPHLPLKWMRVFPEWLVQRSLGRQTPIDHDGFETFLLAKHLNRNALEFTTFPQFRYEERKQMLKPFEILMEAAILKSAQQDAMPHQRETILNAYF